MCPDFIRTHTCPQSCPASAFSFFSPWKNPQKNPAKNAHDHHYNECAAAIDENIFFRRPATCHKRLMIFIQSGKADADQHRQHNEWKSTQPIDIERKCHSNCQQKVFRHVSNLSHFVVNGIGFHGNRIVIIMLSCESALYFYRLAAYFVA